MENLAGTIIKGYDLINLIDAGSFGAVYLARQQVVEREVALKILWPTLASRPNFIRRFETEAQLVAGLEHPHIVPLYDYWRDPEGAYIVMRLLRGGHLRDRMKRSTLDLDMTLVLFNQIASALIFAHRYGIVHRDIKPENILLDEEGNAYLTDFGIAQIVRAGREGSDEDMLGSIAYAAPEQFSEDQVSPLADQYSLGVLLFEMLTGQHPFPELDQMTPRQIVRQRSTQTLPLLTLYRPDFPDGINEILLKATRLEPSQRYPDIIAFLNAVEAVFERTTRTGAHPIVRLTSDQGEERVIQRRTALPEYTDVPNPYKGLRTFQEADNATFFGRDHLTRQLVRRLEEDSEYANFLAVVGPSGSGKSSVVKAGLIPALRIGALKHSELWFYVEMVPGARPFKELEAALMSVAAAPQSDLTARLRSSPDSLNTIIREILPDDSKSELFLVIDQFEEVFTLVNNEDEATAFITALQDAILRPDSRLRLLITLRADFYDRPLLRPLLSDMMSKRTEVVVPLNRHELEQAIVLPARRVGVVMEPGLTDAIINEVIGQPATLPLLQYLMRELFERRDGNLLTLRAYHQMGGVRGALARQADTLFKQSTAQQKVAMRQLLLRLITLGEGTEDTRRRVTLSELTSLGASDPTAMREVIDVLSESRLLTFDRDPESHEPTVEITHEAIIREWSQLRSWLDASREDLRAQRNLARLAAEWRNAGRDSSYLLMGTRLRQFESWLQHSDIGLNRDEQVFLEASLNEQMHRRTLEMQQAEQQERLEIRARNRLRILVVVLAVAVVLSSVLTVFAVNESNRAQQESEVSLSLVQDASAREALRTGNSDLAILLALQANTIQEPPPQVERTLAEIAFAPGTRLVLTGHTASVTGVDISPDGQRIVSSSQDSTVRIWDAATGELLQTLNGHRADVEAVAYSPDGQYILSGSLDFDAILWDAASGSMIRTLRGHSEVILSLAFSPDSTQAATASRDGTIRLWDLATGEQLRQFDEGSVSVLSVAYSPDGNLLLAGMGDGTVHLWDLRTGDLLHDMSAHSTAVNAVAFMPDGTQVTSGSADETVIVWDVESGQVRRRLDQLSGAVTSVTFTPDGDEIIASTRDGILHILEVETGRERTFLQGHQQEINAVDVSRDGTVIVTGSNDLTLRLWNLADPTVRPTEAVHDQRISGMDYSDTALVSASLDGRMVLWDDQQMRPLNILPLEDGARALSANSDGTVFVGLPDGVIQHWQLAENALLSAYAIHEAAVVYINAQEDRVVSTAQDGSMVIWEPASATILTELAFDQAILSVAFDEAGNRIAFGLENELVMWDLGTNTEVMRLRRHSQPIRHVAFSPDGSTLLSAGRDQIIILWDARNFTELRRLTGHSDVVHKVVYSADNQLALSGANNGEVFLWDLGSGELLQQFNGTSAPALQVALSPDGRTAAAGRADGSIQRWRIFGVEELRAWVRENRYLRDFSCIERTLYRIEPGC